MFIQAAKLKSIQLQDTRDFKLTRPGCDEKNICRLCFGLGCHHCRYERLFRSKLGLLDPDVRDHNKGFFGSFSRGINEMLETEGVEETSLSHIGDKERQVYIATTTRTAVGNTTLTAKGDLSQIKVQGLNLS
jgi:hypothetical protein